MAWYVDDSSERLWYEVRGHGPPIVFIHGWCMSSAVWGQQMESLSGSFQVIAIDLPGHGKSSLLHGKFNMERCVSCLVGLFEFLHLHDVILAGWSLGSLIVLESCASLRDRLCALVLIGSSPRFTQGGGFQFGLSISEVDGMTRKVQRSLRRAMEGFCDRMFVSGELDDPLLADAVQMVLSGVVIPEVEVALQALEALVETDMRDRLSSIDLPTLIMNGDGDVICLPEASVFLAQHISSAQLIVFTECGHAPFLTQSKRFNECLEEFKGRVGDSAD